MVAAGLSALTQWGLVAASYPELDRYGYGTGCNPVVFAPSQFDSEARDRECQSVV